jgi:protein SHQ1
MLEYVLFFLPFAIENSFGAEGIMLTPSFRCRQDGKFVIVEILLPSVHCKVSSAELDITENQFTLYASPYYLRLTFNELLEQGKGERAVYNVEQNCLTVYLPKMKEDESFTDLDFPQMLLATSKQRIQIIKETVASAHDDAPADSDDEEAESETESETEFVQTVPPSWEPNQGIQGEAGGVNSNSSKSTAATNRSEATQRFYGFNRQFTGVFYRLDRAQTDIVVDLPDPEKVPMKDRNRLQEADELSRFDEAGVMFLFDDEGEEGPEEGDGETELRELRNILRFKPSYVLAFEEAIAQSGVKVLTAEQIRSPAVPPSQRPRLSPFILEEIDVPVCSVDGDAKGNVPTWEGNVGTLGSVGGPGFEFANSGAASSTKVADEARTLRDRPRSPTEPTPAGGLPTRLGLKLAVLNAPPPITLTIEETQLLTRLSTSNYGCPPKPLGPSVPCLLAELILCYTYDALTTKEESTVESLWTIVKLSSSLSWLNTHTHLYDVCRSFIRRVLCFPLYRSFELAVRCIRDTALILLSGRLACVRALLHIKELLDHSETQYCLSALFLNPLLQYLTEQLSESSANEILRSIALGLHEVVTASDEWTIARPADPDLLEETLRELQISDGPDTAGVQTRSRSAVYQSLFGGGPSTATQRPAPPTVTTEKVLPLGLFTVGLPFGDGADE